MHSSRRVLFSLCAFAAVAALTPALRANTIDVQQSGFGFVPHDVTIDVGDSVTWHWSSFNHTVTEGTDGTIDGNEAFNSNLNASTPTFSVTFDAAFLAAHPMPGGLFNYFCFVHFASNMTGTITVIGEPGTSFCAGDGIDPLVTTACPCGNTGAPGFGCANSVDANGAHLTATGTTSPDAVVLHTSGMPTTVTAIYLKGSASVAGGVVFGDGVLCAGGTLLRLGQENNLNGASSYPTGTQQSVSVKGATPAGSGLTAHYQTYYRNASASFCPPATFNVSNGYQITW